MPKKRASLWGQHFSKYRKSAPPCRRNLPDIWGCVLFLNFPLSRKKKIYPSPVNHLKTYPRLCRQRITPSDCRERSRDARTGVWIHCPCLTQSWPHSSHAAQQESTLPFDFQDEEPSPETPAIELNLQSPVCLLKCTKLPQKCIILGKSVAK